jgi:hypothetical protein
VPVRQTMHPATSKLSPHPTPVTFPGFVFHPRPQTPMRLFPGLPLAAAASSSATLYVIRRLACLGRRAMVIAGESLLKQVVPDTAFKKLQVGRARSSRMLWSTQHMQTLRTALE